MFIFRKNYILILYRKNIMLHFTSWGFNKSFIVLLVFIFVVFNSIAKPMLEKVDCSNNLFDTKLVLTKSLLSPNNFKALDVDQLLVSLNSLTFEPTASGKSITITSNVNWTISGIPAWLTLSSTSGTGNQVITFTPQNNGTTLTRNASITISGNAINQVISVSQYGVASLTVGLDLNNVQKDISNKPLGINMNYLMDGTFLSPTTPTETGLALKSMGTKFLRYPGGEKSDNFFWASSPWTNGSNPKTTNCVFPSNDTRFVNNDNVTIKSAVLDFDEFMAMSIAAGGEPVIVVPYDCIYPVYSCGARPTPTKAEVITNAVEWVRYANITKGYNIKYWMIGNETWTTASYNGQATPAQYAADIVDFSDAMKAIDPTINIIANGSNTNSFWSNFLTATVASKIDLLTVSNYPTYNYVGGYNYYKNNNVVLDNEVTDAINAVNGISNATDRNRIKVSVAEFNTIDWSMSNWTADNNLGHAIASFECFGQTIKHQKLEFACFWNTRWNDNAILPYTNDLFDAINPSSNLNPNGKAIKIWGDFMLPKLLVSNSSNPVKTFTTYDPATNKLNVMLINKETSVQTVNVTLGTFPTGSAMTKWELKGTGEADNNPIYAQNGLPTIVGSNVYADLAPVSITILSFSPSTNLAVNPTSFYFPSSGNAQSLAITSNLNWTITNLPAWLSVNVASGTGNQIVTLTATANASISSQVANITVSDGTLFLSVPITQAGLPDTTAPTAPTPVTSASITSTGFTLNWGAATDAVGVTDYEIFANGVFVATSTTNTYNLTALIPSTAYSMQVRAKDAAGNYSALSAAIVVNTLVSSENLGFENNFTNWSTYGTASISTTAANVHTGAKSGFFSNGGGNYTLTGLIPGATYMLNAYVKAVTGTENWVTLSSFNGSQNPGVKTSSTSWTSTGNILFTMGAGNTTANLGTYTDASSSAYFDSFTVNQVVSDTTPPSQPTALVASSITQTSFTLNWAASLDVGGVTGYDIYKDGFNIGSSATTSFNLIGLTAATAYNITVVAKDAVPNFSAQSPVLVVTTDTAVQQPFYFNPFQSDLTVLANWGTNTDGTGTAPANFTTNGDVFVLTSNQTLSLAFTLGAGTTLQIGNAGNPAVLTLNTNFIVDGNLIISNGKLAIGSNTLTLNGDFVGSATNCLSANGLSNLVIGGTSPLSSNLYFDQSTPGDALGTATTQVSNGTTNRLANFTLGTVGQASKNVILGNQLQITGVMRLNSGTLDAGTGGKLVLISTQTTSAHLATLQTGAFPSDLTGTVNVQSFFKGGDDRYYRGFRMIASPIVETTPTPSFFSNMKNRFIITGPAGGGFDVGGSIRPNSATIQMYTEAPALQTQSYTNLATITTPVIAGKGYYFFYRGSKDNATTSKVNSGVSPYLATRFMPAEDWTATYIGEINKGDFDIPVTYTNNSDPKDGYNLIGNPYPSTIDFSQNANSVFNNAEHTATLTNFLSIMKPNRTGFVTLSDGVINNPINVGDNIRFIQPGQAFFVKVTSSGNIRIKETNKNGGTAPIRLLSQPDKNGYTITNVKTLKRVSDAETTSPRQLIRLRLVDDEQYEETTMVLEKGNLSKFEGFDAPYFAANGNLLCNTLTSDGVNTAINFLPAVDEVSEIKIAVNATETKTSFKLLFTDLTAVKLKDVFLKDNYLGTLTPIDVANNQYIFGIDKAVSTTFGNERFELIIQPKAVLPITLKSFTATKLNYAVKLNFETASEQNVSHFEIQRSSNGEVFITIAKVNASASRNLSQHYAVDDKNPAFGTNYYRLKTVDNDGKIQFSPLRLVSFNINTPETLSVFPNPVKNYLNVNWNVTVKSDKSVSVLDLSGKKVLLFQNIKANSLTKNVSTLPKGVYILELSNQKTKQAIGHKKFIKD